jgi:NAD(P)-dependent dehydrogenase (short-subunit alcohol dehydrogenase family)
MTQRALVTGVTSGIGEHAAAALARRGFEVVLAARNPDKLAATDSTLRASVPDAVLHPLVVDLADLSSVRRAAAEAAGLGPLDVLVNNAGVMATPHRRTVDGFELQLGTNHLGHFALTGLLLPSLLASGDARVVTVSSLMARTVRTVPTDDPRVPRRYRKWASYAGSKLANLLFTVELDRRARRRDAPLTAVATHPGYAATNLVDSGMNLDRRRLDGAIGLAFTRLVGQSAQAGSLPLVMAATEPGLEGGSYVGPGGQMELNGTPRVVSMPRAAHDADLADRLWTMSEEATGVRFGW